MLLANLPSLRPPITLARLIVAGAVLATAPLAALGLGASAPAQVFVAGEPGPSRAGGNATITPATLDRYAAILNLDDAQRQAANALHEAYLEGQHAASKAMADKLKELRPALEQGDRDVIENQMPAAMETRAKAVAKLEQTFLDDLKALLTPAQIDSAWPKLERLRRRDQMLRMGALSGSDVDLLTLVDRLKLSDADRTGLKDTLDLYEIDMDRLLQDIQRDRDEAQQQSPAGGPVVLELGNADQIRARVKARLEQAARIKALNQRYIRLISAALPEQQRAALEEQFKVASFRTIYRDSPAARKLAAAEKFDDLTPEQRARLRAMADAYRSQVRAANDRWAAAQAQAEADGKPVGGGTGVMFAGPGGAGGDQHDAFSNARQARRDLDKRLADDLDSVLTDDQRSRLPKPQTAARTIAGQNVEVIGDGDGNHAVFVSRVAIGDDEDADGEDPEEGVIVHQVIVTTDDETQPVPPPPADPKDSKKQDEPKK